MAHTITYNPAAGMIETVVQGKIASSEAKEIISEIIQIAAENNCFFCLTDYRQAIIDMSTSDIYSIPKIVSNKQASTGLRLKNFKRAIVVEKGLIDFRFLETVTLNMGQHIKLFTDMDEAKKWLFET